MRRFFLTILLLFAMMLGSSFAQPEIYILGPSGGYGGTGFTDEDIKENQDVRDVNIWTGPVVNGIKLINDVDWGQRYAAPTHGSDDGTQSVFTLQPGEYITGISGKYGRFVDSIQIHTNLRVSPRYGGSGGSAEYIYEAPSGWEIAGFCGRSGDVIDAIGVVLRKQS